MERKIVNLDSVEKYNHLVGLETLHPLITVADLNHATKSFEEMRWNYGLYAIFLKMELACTIQYGRQNYDYQEGTVVCFAPGQIVNVTRTSGRPTSNVLGLLFHPDLLHGTSLAKTMRQYTYFSYAVNESLHLSERERSILIECFRIIASELERGIDKHTKTILVNQIEMVLNYLMRFYERQFITRSVANSDILTRFENLLNDYFEQNNAAVNGLPTVKYMAEKLCISPNYFGDLLKKETGKSPQEYIQLKVIETGKQRLAMNNAPVSEVAYSLGFQYAQHFTRLFKKATGMTPSEYRKAEEMESPLT